MQVQFKTGQTEAVSTMYILVKEHWTASLPLLPCSLPSDCKDLYAVRGEKGNKEKQSSC